MQLLSGRQSNTNKHDTHRDTNTHTHMDLITQSHGTHTQSDTGARTLEPPLYAQIQKAHIDKAHLPKLSNINPYRIYIYIRIYIYFSQPYELIFYSRVYVLHARGTLTPTCASPQSEPTKRDNCKSAPRKAL